MLEPIQKLDVTKMTIKQFTEHLNKTTTSIFSPTPSREPTPPRATTPPRDESKGKEGQLTNEEVVAQVKEMKRLADLNDQKEKSEKSLQKIMQSGLGLRRWPINSSMEATMRITRGKDPLNVNVYDKFKLNTLGFIEWLEWVLSQAKALGIPPPPELSTFGVSINDKKKKRSSDILKEVFVQEDIVIDGMHKNLVPLPDIVGSRGQVIREPKLGIFFYNGNFDLVFQRKEEFRLATTAQLIKQQSAIQRGTLEAEEMIKKLELTIKARNDVNHARKNIQDNLDGLGQYM
nr:hypothetical protein [Tanacetum cinerariifolium]